MVKVIVKALILRLGKALGFRASGFGMQGVRV